ncbi:MAG: hypothetical protein ACTSUY_05185 [Alphaproteobacteria bacterium]
MTSPALAAAALQLGAYRAQVRPQGGAAFVVPAKPAGAPGVETRALVQKTDSVRIELSAAARTTLLQLQTLNQPAKPARPMGRERPAGHLPGPAYAAPGGRLDLRI